jgi:hypothetical protein
MESINTIQVKTNQCPYCDQPVLAGSYVCHHCQNNLQIRKSVQIKLQSNGLLLAIYMALLGSAFFASGFMVAKKDIIHFRPSYRHITAKIEALDTLIEKPHEEAFSAAQPAPEREECQKWDPELAFQQEEEVCLIGNVLEAGKNSQGMYTIIFDGGELFSLMVIDDEQGYDFSTGDCIRARGDIIEWQGKQVIESSGDISKVKSPYCE